MKYKITIGYVNGTEETYYVREFVRGPEGLRLIGVEWRGRFLAEEGFIPSTAVLSMWLSPVRP